MQKVTLAQPVPEESPRECSGSLWLRCDSSVPLFPTDTKARLPLSSTQTDLCLSSPQQLSAAEAHKQKVSHQSGEVSPVTECGARRIGAEGSVRELGACNRTHSPQNSWYGRDRCMFTKFCCLFLPANSRSDVSVSLVAIWGDATDFWGTKNEREGCVALPGLALKKLLRAPPCSLSFSRRKDLEAPGDTDRGRNEPAS